MWFQTAEAESEWLRDISRAVKLFIRGTSQADTLVPADEELAAQPPTIKGGMFTGMPENPPKSDILSDADVAYYTRQFSTSGLQGPMNWYRNVERNWEWNKKVAAMKVTQPALMITTGRDEILTAEAANRIMPPHFDQLTIKHVEEAGHWVLQEKPADATKHIAEWLRLLPSDLNFAAAGL
jgi:soluble epoxide hydrolase/lipid-phosphate phosphatase